MHHPSLCLRLHQVVSLGGRGLCPNFLSWSRHWGSGGPHLNEPRLRGLSPDEFTSKLLGVRTPTRESGGRGTGQQVTLGRNGS